MTDAWCIANLKRDRIEDIVKRINKEKVMALEISKKIIMNNYLKQNYEIYLWIQI